VTVLFGDLRGSMELVADRDPEEARRLLDPVLERMMEADPFGAVHVRSPG
jgi:class 3 adenylate cyclase